MHNTRWKYPIKNNYFRSWSLTRTVVSRWQRKRELFFQWNHILEDVMRCQWNKLILLGLMAFRQANIWNSHSKRYHVNEWFPWEGIVLLQLSRWHFICTDKNNNSYVQHGRAEYTTIAPTNNISDAHHTVVIPPKHHSEKVNSPNNALILKIHFGKGKTWQIHTLKTLESYPANFTSVLTCIWLILLVVVCATQNQPCLILSDTWPKLIVVHPSHVKGMRSRYFKIEFRCFALNYEHNFAMI